MKRRWASFALFIMTVVGLFAGLGWLVHLRFESGDAYPLRSSLRADPVGTKALFEAYENLPDLRVERNFIPLQQVDGWSPETVLLSLNSWGWSMFEIADYRSVRDLVDQGGRLVIAMNPTEVAYKYLEDESELGSEQSSDSQEEDTSMPFTRSPTGYKSFWAGLELQHGEHEGGEAMRSPVAAKELPERLPWREGGIFSDYDDSIWRPLYLIGDEVVGVQRDFGRGTIVVLTDDYLFSNQALLEHRFVDFLTWVIADKTQVVFEETHLGVSEGDGVAVLIRRYQLGGFFAAFFGFMALVVWRGASPLLPPFASRTRENVILTEHSTEAGLGDLVRRSIPRANLSTQAFECWKKSFIRSENDRAHYADQLKEVEAVLKEATNTSKRGPDNFKTHSKIKSIINRKKRRRL